jgi:uncharacterized iron-regulated membrane protein
MRRLLVWLHRWVGLAMTPFLVIVALTGSVIAFQEELDHWLNADLFTVPIRDAPTLDVARLRDKAQALEPRADPDVFMLPQAPDEAFLVILSPKTDPVTGKPFDLSFNQLFLDPYTGEKLGARDSSEISLGRRGIIAFIYRLHWSLAAPETIRNYGIMTLGVVALAWTIDCFVAFYLTFPLQLSAAHSRSTRHSWWSRWKTAWLVRWSGGSYRLNFDIHRAFGLWTWAMLLVFAWSGVAFNLPEVYKPAMGALFDMGASTHEADSLAKPIQEPGILFGEAYGRAQNALAKAAAEKGFSILGERIFALQRPMATYVYVARGSKDWTKHGEIVVALDANDGKLKRIELGSGATMGESVNSWLLWLHMAAVFGLPMQLFVCALGFVITALCVTGVYVWWKKRSARRVRRERSRTPVLEQSPVDI